MAGVSKKTPQAHWQKVMDAAGWSTAQDMAKASDISHSVAHNIIFGAVTPSPETILKIAEAAGVKPKDIADDIFQYLIALRATTGATTR